MANLSMSVNVSGRQLLDPSLVPDVVAILARTGLPPEALTLEITESVLMADLEGAIDRLDESLRPGNADEDVRLRLCPGLPLSRPMPAEDLTPLLAAPFADLVANVA
jgi:hypothetical protein